MAITITDSMTRNKAQFEAILQRICKIHGLARTDFVQAEEDRITGHIKLTFQPPSYIPELMQLAQKVHDLLNDEFRGEVLRAAVPGFATMSAEMADMILNPKQRVVWFDPQAHNYKWMDN